MTKPAPLAELLSAIIALAVMTAAGSIALAGLAVSGSGLRWSGVVVVGVALLAGGLAYVASLVFVRKRLLALTNLTAMLARSSLRPRDHALFVRSKLRSLSGSDVPELSALVHALDTLLGRIEQRQERHAAWIGAVVHDLKTPIAASANALGVIGERYTQTNPGDGELISEIALRLRELAVDMQRMLDVSRFERENVHIESVRIDLGDLVDSVVRRLGSGARVQVRWSGSGHAIGDPILVERAVENLVSNAIRYARSRVSVDVYPNLVRIADDGAGLPAPLEHLSQPFRSEPMEVDGLSISGGAGGIGMFLARRVLEIHGGRLVVESTGPRGTTLLAFIGAT